MDTLQNIANLNVAYQQKDKDDRTLDTLIQALDNMGYNKSRVACNAMLNKLKQDCMQDEVLAYYQWLSYKLN